MKVLFVVAVAALIAAPAYGQVQHCYSWEDGGTVLGLYGNFTDATNVSGIQAGVQGSAIPITCPGAYDGDFYLHVAEAPHDGTPQAYLAWIVGLTDGAQVTVSFYNYENTPDASPSMRIWAHYTPVGGDVMSYGGSASGPSEYGSADNAWDQITDVPYTWTFDSNLGANDGLVIEGRGYSTPATDPLARTDYFIDYICVTAPDNAVVYFPEPASPVEDSTWGKVKALYR
jgi:hypothetical protein